MGGDCSDSQFWDVLLKKCIDCHTVCRQQHITARCSTYCVSARCKALHGHYYDLLVKKCLNCTKICGRHPAACPQHCHVLPPPATTQTLRLDVAPHVPSSRGPPALEDSALLLYSLLAVCLLLLFSSLSLALAVLLRGKKEKSANSLLSEGRKREPRQEVRLPGIQEERNAKGRRGTQERTVPGAGCHAGYEAADDSIPTETCVCVYCFPDLKSLSQTNDGPSSGKMSLREPSSLQRTQYSGPVWTEGSQHHQLLLHHQTTGPETQTDPGVG